MLFAEYIEEWKDKARLKTSPVWKMGQDQILRDHILPHLGHKKLNAINAADISVVMSASIAKGHSGNQQKKIYMVLSKVFRDSTDNFFEYREKSPVKKRFHLPEVKETKAAYMGFEKALIFLEYTMNHPLYAEASWIETLAGLRISEIEPLEWSDVDFDNNIIHITKSYSPWTKVVRNFTKNKGHYQAQMPPMLRAFLWNRKKRSGLICQNTSGGMISRNSFRGFMNRTQKILSLSVRSSHGLRHSCSRIFIEHGARDEEIQQLLGHKCLASIKPYNHRENLNILKDISQRIA